MPARFTYEKLNHSRKEVRYLQVLSKPGAVIQCRLQNGPLEPGHICLSHRWTDKEGPREIFLNDRPFAVSANVWHFLDVARHKYRPEERFWIDAICINQQDNDERNKQVPLMGEIYRSAKLVVSWLGVCDKNTKMCIDAIRTRKVNMETNHFDEAICQNDPFEANFWDHLLHFFQNEYWKRAWVVQEVLLASDGYLLVGDVQLDWQTLKEFWTMITRADIAPQTHLQRLTEWNFGHETKARQALKKDERAPLRSLIARYGKKQVCSDFHDKVYSYLSLARERDSVTVDYSSSRETLFFTTLRDCGTDKCFCFASYLMNVIRLGASIRKKAPFSNGAWLTEKLPTDEDQTSFVSFGINIGDSFPLGDGIYYYTNPEDAYWLRSVPRDWKRQIGKNLRFLYTAVPADFLIRNSPTTGEWYCKAIRFHRPNTWTRHIETFDHWVDSGISVHCQEGTNIPCCLQLTKSALLKLLIFGEQHSVCHSPSYNGFSISTIDGKLACGQPVERFASDVVRRASIPYRSCSIPATPRSTPSVKNITSAPGSPAQVRNHAQELRRSLFQVREHTQSARPNTIRR